MEEKNTQAANKSFYESSYGEIFRKNFVAGFGKALGGLFVNLLLYLFLGILFIKFLLPTFEPLIGSITTISQSLQKLQNLKQESGISIPNINVQKILGQ